MRAQRLDYPAREGGHLVEIRLCISSRRVNGEHDRQAAAVLQPEEVVALDEWRPVTDLTTVVEADCPTRGQRHPCARVCLDLVPPGWLEWPSP